MRDCKGPIKLEKNDRKLVGANDLPTVLPWLLVETGLEIFRPQGVQKH